MAAVIKLPMPDLEPAIETLPCNPVWDGSAIQRLCKDLAEKKKVAGKNDSVPPSTRTNEAQTPSKFAYPDAETLGPSSSSVANKADGSEVIMEEDGDGLVLEQKDALTIRGLGWPILLIRYHVELTGTD